jgi:hypothetical protein
MLFGNIFEDNVNSHRTSEDNDIDRMRREILQNIIDAQEYTRDETSNASPIEFACDEHGQLRIIPNANIVTADYDETLDYYKEFWKVFLTNEIKFGELKQLATTTQSLKAKVATIEVQQQMIQKL